MRQALHPVYYEDIRSVWNGQKETVTAVEDEDQHLSSLSNMKGWQILKAHIDSLKQGLDKRLSQSVLQSLGDSQIKTDALFAVLGKELLNSIISKVEDSALEVERIEHERERQAKAGTARAAKGR